MTSKIKATGVKGRLLHAMANRNGHMASDYKGFPPSKVFLPLKKLGLVVKTRRAMGSWGPWYTRLSVWELTAKGWSVIGREKREENE